MNDLILETRDANDKSRIFAFFLLLMIIFGLLSIVVIVYLWMKNKKLEETLSKQKKVGEERKELGFKPNPGIIKCTDNKEKTQPVVNENVNQYNFEDSAEMH